VNSQAAAAEMENRCGRYHGHPPRLLSEATAAPARDAEPGAAGMRWLWGMVADGCEPALAGPSGMIT